jgi:hypothetical protein
VAVTIPSERITGMRRCSNPIINVDHFCRYYKLILSLLVGAQSQFNQASGNDQILANFGD